jgi:hypothetical protein
MTKRRRILEICGTAFVATAGCVGRFDSANTEVEEVTWMITLGEEIISKDTLDDYVADVHDRFATAGVWGDTRTEPDHELEYRGAWKKDLEHIGGVSSEHLLVLYHVPDLRDGNNGFNQIWLWSGVDMSEFEGYLHELHTGVTFPNNIEMGQYSPADTYRATDSGQYPVGLTRPTASTLATNAPLSSGTIDLKPEETRIGDGGQYSIRWQGEHEDRMSIIATCEGLWPPGESREFELNAAIEASNE